MTALANWRRNGAGEKMSQEALARRLGISRSYLSEIETGAKVPPLRLAFEIESITGGAVRAASFVSTDEAAA